MGKWDDVASAMDGKRIIRFDYDGRERVGEPHCLGKKGGRECMRFFQTGGASESGNMGWKLLYLDKMGLVAETGNTFPGSRPTDTHPDYIDYVKVVKAPG